MKKTIFIIFAVLALNSCRKASELPPINDGFATEFILPDPENLTSEDREYLEELEKEYTDAIKK